MRQYQPTPDFYHDYIAHHGILGMSWGERNGPPYPLDSDVSTGKSLRKKKKNKGENRVDTKQSKHDQKLQKEHDKNVKKADRDFQETHKLFTTSDGRSWYVGTGHDERMKDGMNRYQTLSLKGKNGSTDHYHIDRKYNVVVQKTTTDKNDNRNISSFDKNDKDLIAKLRKQQQKQWDRERW